MPFVSSLRDVLARILRRGKPGANVTGDDSEAQLKYRVPARLGTRQTPGVTILHLPGKLCGEEQCNALKEQMPGLLARPQTARIVLNLENVSGIDETGFATLVKAYTDTRHRGGELKLVCPPGKVLRLLQVTKLITRLPSFLTTAIGFPATTSGVSIHEQRGFPTTVPWLPWRIRLGAARAHGAGSNSLQRKHHHRRRTQPARTSCSHCGRPVAGGGLER